ncbi:MAG: polysaccharide deacetylase family protein [Bacteroidota bacterium]
MYLRYIPDWLQRQLPTYTWRLPTSPERPTIYLSFDDGPTPDITTWVLEQLAQYDAKATFFWVGEQVMRHPELAHKVLDAGHAAGNHSHTHLNGREVNTHRYLRDFLRAQQTIEEYTGFAPRLFRPPYGRLRKAQRQAILQYHEIVMMDVVSGDFDPRRSGQECAEAVIRNTRPGSIILLHDSLKAWPRLEVALPRILSHFADKGYSFAAHPDPIAAPRELSPADLFA